jgi:hypothetical protein
MSRNKPQTDEGPAIIQCAHCGHRSTTRTRGFPALGVADLAGKTLVCTRCGCTQRFDDTAVGKAQRAAMLAEMFQQAPPTASVN